MSIRRTTSSASRTISSAAGGTTSLPRPRLLPLFGCRCVCSLLFGCGRSFPVPSRVFQGKFQLVNLFEAFRSTPLASQVLDKLSDDYNFFSDDLEKHMQSGSPQGRHSLWRLASEMMLVSRSAACAASKARCSDARRSASSHPGIQRCAWDA